MLGLSSSEKLHKSIISAPFTEWKPTETEEVIIIVALSMMILPNPTKPRFPITLPSKSNSRPQRKQSPRHHTHQSWVWKCNFMPTHKLIATRLSSKDERKEKQDATQKLTIATTISKLDDLPSKHRKLLSFSTLFFLSSNRPPLISVTARPGITHFKELSRNPCPVAIVTRTFRNGSVS